MRLPRLTAIRPRLMLIVAVALAPLALASIVQALLNFHAYRRQTDGILQQTALYVAYNEQSVFAEAGRLLDTLARNPASTAHPQGCWRVLKDVLIGSMPIVNITRVDAEGRIVCMAAVAPPRPGYAKLKWWPLLRASNRTVVGNQFESRLLHRPLLPIALPLHNRHGAFVGALSASVDLGWLEAARQISRLPQGTLSLILDSDGNVLASNRAAPAGLAKAVVRHARDAHQQVFAVATGDGTRWRWVVEPIGISDKLVALGIPEPRFFGSLAPYLLADILITVLIVVSTCAAIWLGAEWLVVRWTHYLKRVAMAYARNHFALALDDLNAAPDEFRLLGCEMERMAGAIQDRDRTLSEALERQSAMTREIHHRVKNNLQIVSSLVNIYAGNVSNYVARGAFRQIIARIDALTLIQRLAEGNESEPAVDMEVLLDQLAEQIRTLAAENRHSLPLTLAVERCFLPPDTATPIALFAIEALTFDLFQARPDMRERGARLAFTCSDGGYLLVVENASPGILPGRSSLADRVMRSLAEQLRGRCTIDQLDGGGCRLTLKAPVSASAVNADASPEPGNVYALDTARQRQG